MMQKHSFQAILNDYSSLFERNPTKLHKKKAPKQGRRKETKGQGPHRGKRNTKYRNLHQSSLFPFVMVATLFKIW